MSRLPQVGSDDGAWGEILNDFLAVSHDHEGKLNPGAISKTSVGLGNVDNTADASKPNSIRNQTALNLKAADASVVHLAGSETITGAKNCTGGLSSAGSPVVTTSGLSSYYTSSQIDGLLRNTEA